MIGPRTVLHERRALGLPDAPAKEQPAALFGVRFRARVSVRELPLFRGDAQTVTSACQVLQLCVRTVPFQLLSSHSSGYFS